VLRRTVGAVTVVGFEVVVGAGVDTTAGFDVRVAGLDVVVLVVVLGVETTFGFDSGRGVTTFGVVFVVGAGFEVLGVVVVFVVVVLVVVVFGVLVDFDVFVVEPVDFVVVSDDFGALGVVVGRLVLDFFG